MHMQNVQIERDIFLLLMLDRIIARIVVARAQASSDLFSYSDSKESRKQEL